jgi:hypothetical protein
MLLNLIVSAFLFCAHGVGPYQTDDGGQRSVAGLWKTLDSAIEIVSALFIG